VAAVYYDDCSDPYNNYHAYLFKEGIPYRIDYMRATIEVTRTIFPCQGNLFTAQGKSMVLPVNIEPGALGSDGAFVQLGYLATTMDRSIRWVYTKSETSGGVVVKAPSHVPDPVPGRSYTLWAYYDAGADKWRYIVYDNYLDQEYSWYGDTATRTAGMRMWSGFEVYNNHDTLGGANYTVKLTNIGYQIAGSGSTEWWGSANDDVNQCCGTRRSYWNYSSGTTNGRAWMSAYTENH
jgi:hypothetical protein